MGVTLKHDFALILYFWLLADCHGTQRVYKEANTYLSTNVLMTARVSSTKRSMVDLVTMKWWLQDDRPVPKW